MTTHVHEVTKFGYMGNEAGTAKITLPGPSWEAPAQREHQRPATEPVRLTKPVPRGLVTPKPAMVKKTNQGQKILRSFGREPETTAQRSAMLGFWHKTRKEFVPLTISEIKQRSGVESRDLAALSNRKLITRTTTGIDSCDGFAIYEILPEGRNWVAAYMANKAQFEVAVTESIAENGEGINFAKSSKHANRRSTV